MEPTPREHFCTELAEALKDLDGSDIISEEEKKKVSEILLAAGISQEKQKELFGL